MYTFHSVFSLRSNAIKMLLKLPKWFSSFLITHNAMIHTQYTLYAKSDTRSFSKTVSQTWINIESQENRVKRGEDEKNVIDIKIDLKRTPRYLYVIGTVFIFNNNYFILQMGLFIRSYPVFYEFSQNLLAIRAKIMFM